MITPNMPNFPGMEAMSDTMEFMKNLWSGMGMPGMNPGATMGGMKMPGMVMPTLSVEEIQKKISDLKAVEAWLELNMHMLRGTIQALEVQAATLSALKSMGDALNAGVNNMTAQARAAAEEFGAGGTAKPAQPPQENGKGAGNGAAAAEHAPAGGSGGAGSAAGSKAAPNERDQMDAASLAAPLVNAAAWWNMLQDHFKQAVDTALASEKPAGDGGAKPSSGGRGASSSSSSSSSSSKAAKTDEGAAKPASRKRKPAK
ncbi:hypothetical protein SAMN06265795_101452 [Noviherbaspirillum humi]|uniref:Uncharacterized protein n=1 Tax=Noviherbaspirillum humi TaxID=1688639 RepID=A0A239CHX2_9BURK|nr:PhaM family polyhydroxyalkanoate granule multifunctional regulatory protein [Noviherbaspirillum humi]SNS19288.1 hypothetical protein SAMN06265795_101452 [Noviherbaspirillum humi]